MFRKVVKVFFSSDNYLFQKDEMQLQLLIAVWNREIWYKSRICRSRDVIIEVDSNATVGDVANTLSTRLDIPLSSFFLGLCGNKLNNDTPISALLLGPQT